MKARLPKGYGSGGANNIQQLARQAQKLQDDMEAASKELETKEYEATAGGGAVKVTVTGKMELTKVEISPEVVDPEDVEMLSDLVMAAANEAIRAAAKEKEDKMETISGGLNIPGMFRLCRDIMLLRLKIWWSSLKECRESVTKPLIDLHIMFSICQKQKRNSVRVR